jgi:uncharacterized protein
VPDRLLECLTRFGEIVGASTGIRGLWQADLVGVHDDWWLLEINPRWSSSMELLDAQHELQLIDRHVLAIEGSDPFALDAEPFERTSNASIGGHLGKAIVYASRATSVPSAIRDEWWAHRWRGTLRDRSADHWWADIPNDGSRIDRGYPICTSIARGESLEQTRQRLVDAVARSNQMIDAAENGSR